MEVEMNETGASETEERQPKKDSASSAAGKGTSSAYEMPWLGRGGKLTDCWLPGFINHFSKVSLHHGGGNERDWCQRDGEEAAKEGHGKLGGWERDERRI
ncbi:UNVERIFIED_CONTAM: hypothetical protein FKN15_045860 [Acipenser sinensis]